MPGTGPNRQAFSFLMEWVSECILLPHLLPSTMVPASLDRKQRHGRVCLRLLLFFPRLFLACNFHPPGYLMVPDAVMSSCRKERGWDSRTPSWVMLLPTEPSRKPRQSAVIYAYWLELGHMANLSAGVAGKYRDSPFQNRIRVVWGFRVWVSDWRYPPQGWFSCCLRREWPQGFLVSEPLQGHPLILLRDRVCEMASQ